jgi:hypothetical protein
VFIDLESEVKIGMLKLLPNFLLAGKYRKQSQQGFSPTRYCASFGEVIDHFRPTWHLYYVYNESLPVVANGLLSGNQCCAQRSGVFRSGEREKQINK